MWQLGVNILKNQCQIGVIKGENIDLKIVCLKGIKACVFSVTTSYSSVKGLGRESL